MKRNTSYLTIESSDGNDEIITDTRDISDTLINGITHTSQDIVNRSASGNTI